ncbi:MAG: hypothetical protein ACTSVL_00880 [Promethearchaeota archaeon]
MVFRSKHIKQTRIPNRRSDGAPILYFIDILSNDNFILPILPMPARVDKIFRGYPTLLLFPSKQISAFYGEIEYKYNYSEIFRIFLRNLLFYASKTYKKISNQELNTQLIDNWWKKSIELEPQIISYKKDINFFLQAYLNAFVVYKESGDEIGALKSYCEQICDYCNQRIEDNTITIQYKGKIIEKRMYKTKKKHYFPDIVEFDINQSSNSEKIRTFRKAFIPVMVYDDLLECFLFNLDILEKMEKGEETEFSLISFDILESSHAIVSTLIAPESSEIENQKSFEQFEKTEVKDKLSENLNQKEETLKEIKTWDINEYLP